MKKVLSAKQLKKFLSVHPDWDTNPKKTQLRRSVSFGHYIEGLVLIARIAVHAEILKHHPDIVFKYGNLKLTLTTHEAKGLTALDIDLATRIDKILAEG